MTTPEPGNQQYLPPQQPGYYPPGGAPEGAASGYAGPNYGAPLYGPGEPGPGEPFDGAADPADISRPLYGASFGQAISRFFKQYAKFSGRASRSEFWWMQLFMFLLMLIPMAMMVFGGVASAVWAAGDSLTTDDVEIALRNNFMEAPFVSLLIIGGILAFIIGLALFVPELALYWRRLHDANLAGPFWFLSLTSIGSIIVFVFTLLRSKPEGRRFVSRP